LIVPSAPPLLVVVPIAVLPKNNSWFKNSARKKPSPTLAERAFLPHHTHPDL
jgi:hypothetical protein